MWIVNFDGAVFIAVAGCDVVIVVVGVVVGFSTVVKAPIPNTISPIMIGFIMLRGMQDYAYIWGSAHRFSLGAVYLAVW